MSPVENCLLPAVGPPKPPELVPLPLAFTLPLPLPLALALPLPLALTLPLVRGLPGVGQLPSCVLQVVRRARQVAVQLHVACPPRECIAKTAQRVLRAGRIATPERLRRIAEGRLRLGAGLAGGGLEAGQVGRQRLALGLR